MQPPLQDGSMSWHVYTEIWLSGWSGTKFHDLIEAEMPSGLANRINISGPEVKISALRVQPISLIFHELMGNSVIHGALRALNGSIRIKWIIDTKNAIEIEWREMIEDEAPESDPDKLGIGLQLVTSLVEQLGGRTWTSRTPEGFNRFFELAIE